MIIMRWIILASATLALTSCTGSSGAENGAGAEGTGGSAIADGPRGGQDGAPGTGTATAPVRADAARVVFVGTSLTAGYGVGDDLAWPAVIQQKIAEEGLPFQVVNAGISGETSAGGLRRIDWTLQQPVDVLVVELGANDGLRGLDPDAMRDNIDEILRRARSRHPDVALVVIGMEAPPNLGAAYTDRFRSAFLELARRHDAAIVPFLLDGVAADPNLNLDDGIHPNPSGHRIIAATVWEVMGPLLRQRAARADGAGAAR
jgi:acyl-CoA thioesterase I